MYLPGNLLIPVNLSGNSLIKTSVDLMGLAAAGAAVGLTAAAVGADAGLGGFVLGWITVTAQFIFTTATLSHDGRPRMAGLGVSANTSMSLPPAPVSTLMWSEAVPFTAGTCRQLYYCLCFITLVGHRHHLPQSFLGEYLLEFHNQLH